MTLGGIADGCRITSVTWGNDRGGSGAASGTSTWSASGIVLLAGINVLTVTVNDVGGTSATATLTVFFAPTGPPTDSEVARAVQTLGAKIAANASGAAITGSIDGAIGDGLGDGNGAGGTNPGNGQSNLGASPGAMKSAQMNLGATNDNEPSHVGGNFVGSTGNAKTGWKVWANVRASGWDQDDKNSAAGSLKGSQVNATFGAGHIVMPGVLVGVVSGYETFTYDAKALNGRLKGNGWTAGGYLGWAFAPHMRFDLAATWTGLSYDASAATSSGSFTAGRFLVSSGVTGNYKVDAFVVEPSVRLYSLWENQNAWTDSLGTAQAARMFSEGRFSSGAKVSYPIALNAGTLAPFVGLYGDYRFSSDNALPVNQPMLGLQDGWSARVTTGLGMTYKSGARLSLEGELGGLGTGYQSTWSVSGRGAIPF